MRTDISLKIQTDDNLEPIVSLWLLRILNPLECHQKLIAKKRYNSDELAKALALPGTDDLDEFEDATRFNPRTARKVLLLRHREAEANLASHEFPSILHNNLNSLSCLVGLNQAERDILGFAILLKHTQLLDEACDWFGDSISWVKLVHILSVILDLDKAEVQQALSSQSKLTKTGLLQTQHRRSDFGRYLRDRLKLLSNHFADCMQHQISSPIEWLGDMVTQKGAAHLGLSDYPHLQNPLNLILPYLRKSLKHQRHGINIFLYGVPGTGKTQLCRLMAELLDVPLYEVASEDDDGDPIDASDRLSVLRASQAFFNHAPALLLFDEVDDVINDGMDFFGLKGTAQKHKAWINNLLESNSIPTIWVGNDINSVDPAFIRRFDWVVELPIPPKSQREQIIQRCGGDLLTERTIKQLANCEQLSPAVVSRAASVISYLQDEFSPAILSEAMQDMMHNTLKAQGYSGIKRHDPLELPSCYDPSLINCDTDLIALADGIRQNGSARLCLFGLPGSGKTAYARWLAEQLDKPLVVKQAADLMSQWVGGTEKNIAHAFESAHAANAVLLIDEVDSFLQERGRSHQTWEVSTVNEMLTRMEGFGGVFIASTNHLEGLDAAALRRFDLKIRFDALKPSQTWQLLQAYCQLLNLPEPEPHWQSALNKLDNLTPGDFAVLARQHRFRPVPTVAMAVELLTAECALKTPYKRSAIGFI